MNSRHIFVVIRILLALITLPLSYSFVSAQFEEYEYSYYDKGLIPLINSEEILNQRTAGLNLNMLSRTEGEEITLNLFSDADYIGEVNKVIERDEESFTLFGNLQEGGTFSLSYYKGVVAGTVNQDGRLFKINPSKNENYMIKELNINKFDLLGDISEPDRKLSSKLNKLTKNTQTQRVDDGFVLDLMVVYTPLARDLSGGENGVMALINLAVDNANQLYENSEINTRLRLVRTEEVDYEEVGGDSNTDLFRLYNPYDEYINEVHTWRDESGADMVNMVVATGQCGRALIWSAEGADFAPYAFSTITSDCYGLFYVLAHELGHNLGCSHDHDHSTPRSGLFDYSFGYSFFGQDDQRYNTVMTALSNNKISYFSNPNLNYQGVPIGITGGQEGEADCARSINEASLIASNWRESKQDPICPDPDTREWIVNGYVIDYGDGGQSLIVEFQGVGENDFSSVYNNEDDFILIFDSVYNQCDEFVIESYFKSPLQEEIYLDSKPDERSLLGKPSFSIYKQLTTDSICIDSDSSQEFLNGNNIFVKGTATGQLGSWCTYGDAICNDPTNSRTDYCVDESTVHENYCLDDGILGSDITCPSNYICLGGQCILEGK